MNNKETLEKLRTYQIGVIRSVIASRQGRLGTYSADATDRERLADTDGLAYEEYYESPLTIGYDGLCRNVISLEFCEDGLTPVCLMDGGDGFPLPLKICPAIPCKASSNGWKNTISFRPRGLRRRRQTTLRKISWNAAYRNTVRATTFSGWASCRTSSMAMNPRISGWIATKPPRSATVCSFGSMPRPLLPL